MSWRVTLQSPSALTGKQRALAPKSTYGATLVAHSDRSLQWISPEPPSQELREAANSLGADLNAIPSNWQWGDIGLLASDMDSTLITCECIDEIADFAGVKPQVAAITEAAMRGELDFPQALRARVALLKGIPDTVLTRVYQERVHLTPGAEALVSAAHAAGARTLLISGGFTFFTESLRSRLQLTQTYANELGIENGTLTGTVTSEIVDGAAKARAVAHAKTLLAPGKLTIAMGDGANDIPMMAHADLCVAYRAKPALRAVAQVIIAHNGLDAVRALFP
jgi:phosphoserine phosphatase